MGTGGGVTPSLKHILMHYTYIYTLKYTGCLLISETWFFNAGGYINDPRELKFVMRIAKCLTTYR